MPQQIFPVLASERIMLQSAALILLVFFIQKVFRREPISLISTRHDMLILLLLALVLIGHVINLYPGATWDGFYVFQTVFLLFFIMVNLTKNFDQFRTVCWTLVICTILMSINGLIMQFRGYDLVGNVPVNGRIAWMSHFGDPNDYALAINSFFPLILVNLFEKDISKFKKILLVGAAGITMSAIYFTNSRGGYGALLVILALFAYKKWGLLRGILLGTMFVAVAVVFAPSRMGDVSPYGASAGGRVNAWISGLVMLKSNPVFGVGISNFQLHHHRAAHSAFIQCMAELGVFGYFLWLALIYSSYMGLLQVEKQASGIYVKYAKILQLSLVGFLTSAVFLSQAYTPILYMIFGLSATLVSLAKPPVIFSRNLSAVEVFLTIGIIVASIFAYKVLAIVYV